MFIVCSCCKIVSLFREETALKLQKLNDLQIIVHFNFGCF